MRPFVNRLLALGYPNADKFAIEDDALFKDCVSWIEDRHIRLYPIEERKDLRTAKSPQWNDVFQKYMTDVLSPYDPTDRVSSLNYIINYAVRLYLEDSGNSDNAQEGSVAPSRTESNINVESTEFKSAIEKIAYLLKVPTKPNDTKSNLEAVYKILSTRFGTNEKASESLIFNPNAKSFNVDIKNLKVGFQTTDKLTQLCGAIFRILFINDMKIFQVKVNNIVATIQEITGDPRTDSKLGKVGS